MSKDAEAPDVILDMSVIGYKNWHKMASDNYVPETGNEKSEFSINMYLYILYIVTRLKPKNLIFAMDSRPNWREKYYRDYYLDGAMKLYRYAPKDEKTGERVPQKQYLAKFDQKTIRYFYSKEAEKWMKKKLTKKDIEQLDGKEYLKVKDRKKMEKILYSIIKKPLTPEYKGNRANQPWDYATPKYGHKDEKGKYIPGYQDLFEALSKSLAGTFRAKVILAEGAEADDVITYYVKAHKSPNDLILISVDSDLHQLYNKSLFFKYFNPNINDQGQASQYGGFIDLNKTKVMFDLRKKLLSGDSSDNIPGCRIKDPKKEGWKSTLIGGAGAETLLTEHSLKDIIDMLDPKTFARNRKLIHLDNIPTRINERIALAFKKAKIPEFVEHKEYLAPPRKILLAKTHAMHHMAGKVLSEVEEKEMEVAIEKATTKKPEDMTKKELLAYNKQLEKINSDLSWPTIPDYNPGYL